MAENIQPAATGEVVQNHEQRVRPPVDIFEEGDGLTILSDVPGVAKDAITLQVQDNVLSIEARPTHSLGVEPSHQEFALVTFVRQVPIPETFDAQQITAELTQGVLRLHMPKAESAKPKQIQVTVG